jgi:hypothetical protein
VRDTTYPIQHLVFKDRTTPFDAFAQVNKYHLWNLAVWENKTLEFRGYDLSDYDWQIRAGEDGATFDGQGQSTDRVHNGVVVTFTNSPDGPWARVNRVRCRQRSRGCPLSVPPVSRA